MRGRAGVGRIAPGAALAALAYLALALAWSHPLALHAASHLAIPADTPKPVVMANDQLFAVSAAGRNAAALLEGDLTRLVDQRLCWPMPRSATLGEHAVELGLLALPGWAIWRDPLVAYNLACLLLVMIASLGAFSLVRHWTRSSAAGFVAGLLFGFHPSLIGNLAHPFVVGIHWLPWLLLCFERLLEEGRARHAAGLAATASLQAWVGAYPLLVLVAFALPFGSVRLFQARARLDARRLALLAAAVIVVLMAAGSLLRFYPETSAAWGMLERRALLPVPFASLLPGGAHALGGVGLVLAAATLWPPRPGPLAALLAAGGACLALAGGFGVEGSDALAGLYPWLADRFPLLGAARVPGEVRAGAYLALALLGGLGLARLSQSRSAARSAALAGVVAALVALEYFQPGVSAAIHGHSRRLVLLPRAPDADTLAVHASFDRAGLDGPLLEIPHDVGLRTLSGYSLLSAYHQRATATCFSSHVPPSFLAVGRMAARLPTPRGVEELSAAGLRNLVIHGGADPADAGLAGSLAALPGVRLVAQHGTLTALRLPEPGPSHSDPTRLELLGARLAPEQFSRKRRLVLHLDVRNGAALPFALPHPVAPVAARVRWSPRGGGAPGPWQERRLLLPLGLAAGAVDRLWLEVGEPPEGCDCVIGLEVPAAGWQLAAGASREEISDSVPRRE